MNPQRHYTEDELIAYQLADNPDAAAVARHLESCSACAATSESIAETLRVFSADPVPQPNIDHAWQRLRGSLPAAPIRLRRQPWQPWRLGFLAPACAVLLLLVAAILYVRTAHRPQPDYTNNHPGPLTNQPLNSRVAHLDSAERLLTEVNHTSGPLPDDLRTEVHALALSNAVYIQQAHAVDDPAEAVLLEHLGRVLTTLDHEPPAADKGWHVRFEMNTEGLLLDLRILQQNSIQPAAPAGLQPSPKDLR